VTFGERYESDHMSFEEVLRGHRLTTAHILYRMPDHPSLFQEFVWQEYDIAPQYPRLKRFLDFWGTNLDGKLVQVRVAVQDLISPKDFRYVGIIYRLN
jgi:uncharacterized protein Usg